MRVCGDQLVEYGDGEADRLGVRTACYCPDVALCQRPETWQRWAVRHDCALQDEIVVPPILPEAQFYPDHLAVGLGPNLLVVENARAH